MKTVRKTPYPGYQFQHKNILSITDMNEFDIQTLLDLGDEYVALNRQDNKKKDVLQGKTLINLFFENSTRTRASFELAAKRLGADCINLDVGHSSVKKGETLLDTAATLNAMHPDLLIVRHHAAGAAKLLARKMDCAVINAGDGFHEHPTQALLDALTIRRQKKRLEGLKIAICGDIKHSRVARSNVVLLTMMGAEVNVIAPQTLISSHFEKMGARCFTNLEAGLKDCDVVMMLRLQNERMTGQYVPSLREYHRFFGLTKESLSHAKPDALVMHPGPMNRGVEIASDLADDLSRSVILNQVELGLAIRMACLDLLSRKQQTSIGRF